MGGWIFLYVFCAYALGKVRQISFHQLPNIDNEIDIDIDIDNEVSYSTQASGFQLTFLEAIDLVVGRKGEYP